MAKLPQIFANPHKSDSCQSVEWNRAKTPNDITPKRRTGGIKVCVAKYEIMIKFLCDCDVG